MGNASSLENIHERYYNSRSVADSGPEYSAPCSDRLLHVVANEPFDPQARACQVIEEFYKYLTQQQSQADQVPSSAWELHCRNVDTIYKILTKLNEAHNLDGITEWELLSAIEAQLREFFRNTSQYGPLSPIIISRVWSVSRDIRSRCRWVDRELHDQLSQAGTVLESEAGEKLRIAARQYYEIRARLKAVYEGIERSFERAKQVREWYEQFKTRYLRLAIDVRYRPTLQNLHRLRLSKYQERFVSRDYEGAARIQGTSGSGKTIILIHRALRLALENPSASVRVFTVNRSLATLIYHSVDTINTTCPPNLHVDAFYDFLREVQRVVIGRTDDRGLDDPVSGERIPMSWREFCKHPGKTDGQNIFADPEVQDLVASLSRKRGRPDPYHFLRDEIIYILSAYRGWERRELYLSEPRNGRGIPLVEWQREVKCAPEVRPAG